MITVPSLSPELKREMAVKAGRLALDAINGTPGAAEQARKIMNQLAADRQLIVGG